jgi:hypothetical protein
MDRGFFCFTGPGLSLPAPSHIPPRGSSRWRLSYLCRRNDLLIELSITKDILTAHGEHGSHGLPAKPQTQVPEIETNSVQPG